jgi:hypothetical protein
MGKGIALYWREWTGALWQYLAGLVGIKWQLSDSLKLWLTFTTFYIAVLARSDPKRSESVAGLVEWPICFLTAVILFFPFVRLNPHPYFSYEHWQQAWEDFPVVLAAAILFGLTLGFQRSILVPLLTIWSLVLLLIVAAHAEHVPNMVKQWLAPPQTRSNQSLHERRTFARGIAPAPSNGTETLTLPLVRIAWRGPIAPAHSLNVYELKLNVRALSFLIEAARTDFTPTVEHYQGPRFLRLNAEAHNVAA